MKAHLVLVTAGFAAAVGFSAGAAPLVIDPFTYSDGNLVGNTPSLGGTWAAHSGGGSTPIQVASGKISIAHGTGTREDANIPLGLTLGAGGKLYSSFDLTVADPGATIVDAYFAMFLQGTGNFDGRVWITAPTTSGYRLAISNDNSITDSDGEVRTTDLAFGQTYSVVTVYDYDAKAAKLWINPALETDPSFNAADPGFSDASSAYAFRQAGGNTTQVIDNLKVGTTFADVVPEPASLSLLCLGGLFLRRRNG